MKERRRITPLSSPAGDRQGKRIQVYPLKYRYAARMKSSTTEELTTSL